MALVIRTWNLLHGNPDSPGRRAYLRQMIELVTRDRPDAVSLQELPVWSLARVSALSGMHVLGAVNDTSLPGRAADGFSPPLAGSIDQIYVRGLEVLESPRTSPVARRALRGRVLSDHAPAEAVVA